MVIRRLKENQWIQVCKQIATHGRAAPLSLQYDIDLECNGIPYILRVQPESKRRIVALHALGSFPNGEGTDGKEYRMIEDHAVLSALLEIIVYQGVGARTSSYA